MQAKLALEDGTVYSGTACGATGETGGELVFNTSMMGYQEILTDPSYVGQIVVMTYPHIGNYGVNAEDRESSRIQVAGFVVRQLTQTPSNYRSQADLNSYLQNAGVVGITDIDTRSLVRRLRLRGAMNGVISTQDLDDASLVAKARALPPMAGQDLVRHVTPRVPYPWHEGPNPLARHLLPQRPADKHVVAIDYGMKWNILRLLTQVGCRVTVVPATFSAEAILALQPDGIFLSNGPGDPAAVTYAISTIRQLLDKRPIFGICLGHQLLCLALGAKTFKLKFGHRGANHPVRYEPTGHVEITTQNHGFAVDPHTLPADVEITHVNLNDHTLEGIRHRRWPLLSVQYHPEASAGPHDSVYLFEEFRRLMS
jgi:carbamoyl-phosphate synthase small subunit